MWQALQFVLLCRKYTSCLNVTLPNNVTSLHVSYTHSKNVFLFSFFTLRLQVTNMIYLIKWFYSLSQTEKYLKMLINFVGAWISPLYHLVIELSAMQDVPETILSKAKDIEENKRELLDDLKWILTKVRISH